MGVNNKKRRVVPVLYTVVLFAAGDEESSLHDRALDHLARLGEEDTFIACFALLEFDIVPKSRGFTSEERMEKHALLLTDFQEVGEKVLSPNPSTIYLTAKLEKELGMEYFDTGVAAEALQHDGTVVSTDPAFNKVSGLTRLW